MILAAGLGSRMRPLTDVTPKPLIPVGGRPMIDQLLDRLEQAGVTDAVVNIHHLPDRMREHLAGRTRPRITLSDETEALLDSGGGVLKALPRLGDAFFVLNADTVWIEGPRANLRRLLSAWRPEEMNILLLLAPTTTSVGWANRGDFAMDQEGRLRRPRPGEVTPFAYAGVGLWRSAIFAGMPPVFSLNRLFDHAIESGRLFGLRLDGAWMHVGTPDAIAEAELCIAESVT